MQIKIAFLTEAIGNLHLEIAILRAEIDAKTASQSALEEENTLLKRLLADKSSPNSPSARLE